MRAVLRSIWSWLKGNIYLIAMLLSVGFLGLAESRAWFQSHPHVQVFVIEVAFAVFIASFFSVTIEKYQRQEFVKLVNEEREGLKRDIFLYAYGHALHEQIREELKESLLNQPFYREELQIEWEFTALPEDDFLRLEKKLSYLIVNNTAGPQRDSFAFTQITAAEKELLGTEFRKLTIERNGKWQTFGARELRTEPSPEQHYSVLRKDLDFGPKESIGIHYAFVDRRRKYADDYYVLRQPLVGKTRIRVRVNPPLQLKVTAICRGNPVPIASDHDPPVIYSWELNKALLPFQGFAISWSPMIPPKT